MIETHQRIQIRIKFILYGIPRDTHKRNERLTGDPGFPQETPTHLLIQPIRNLLHIKRPIRTIYSPFPCPVRTQYHHHRHTSRQPIKMLLLLHIFPLVVILLWIQGVFLDTTVTQKTDLRLLMTLLSQQPFRMRVFMLRRYSRWIHW